MQLAMLKPVLERIHGATFASLDSVTFPKPSIQCTVEGLSVVLYRMQSDSGYENKVRKALAEAGKNPDSFKVSPLAWGERVENLPLIFHKGRHYLQCIILSEGRKVYKDITGDVLSDEVLAAYGIIHRFPTNQGLPPSEAVEVRTYDISSISRLAILGEELTDRVTVTRKVLGLKFSTV